MGLEIKTDEYKLSFVSIYNRYTKVNTKPSDIYDRMDKLIKNTK